MDHVIFDPMHTVISILILAGGVSLLWFAIKVVSAWLSEKIVNG